MQTDYLRNNPDMPTVIRRNKAITIRARGITLRICIQCSTESWYGAYVVMECVLFVCYVCSN